MNRLRRVITAVVLVTMLTASGAASAAMDKCPAQGGTIRAAMAGSPPTLDFITSFAAQARDMGVYIYEGLVTVDANYDVAPQLAERWTTSADGKKYTFHLRKGVKFHDGSPVTAGDVVASVERFRTESPRKADLSMVSGVRAVDDATVEITLGQASAAFVPLLAYPGPAVAIMPKKLIEGVAAGKLPQSSVMGRDRTVSPSGSPTSTSISSASPTTARRPPTPRGMQGAGWRVSSTSTSSRCPRCPAGSPASRAVTTTTARTCPPRPTSASAAPRA